MFLFYFSGLGLLWFYQAHPERALPNMAGDYALPHFIATELPPGVGGIVIAAILAAAMSTVDAGLNCLATCSITDFYGRVICPEATEERKLKLAKIMTVVWGVLAMLSAALMIWLYGAHRGRNPLIVISEVTLGFFGGIILGIFLLGVLTKRANAGGALLGAAVGLAAAIAVTAPYYFRELPPEAPRLSFLWINIIGCLATVVSGYLASFFWARPSQQQVEEATYWGFFRKSRKP